MKCNNFFKNHMKRKYLIGILFLSFIVFICVFIYINQQKNYSLEIPSDFSDENLQLAYTIDGEKRSGAFPTKSSGYTASVTCEDGASAEWDNTNWGIINVKANGNTKVKCNVQFISKYTEDILNGADPVLADNLIPVTIANDGTVKKADIATEWYNYGNKVWANAVILLDKSITY